jgi:hypothetical protein
MNTYNVFNCQFTAVQLSLGRECCLSGKEALVEVMNKDFLEVKWNFLSDHKLNVHYHHEYENTKQKNIYMMRVANKRVYPKAKDFTEDESEIRFPYLYVIIDIRQETPVIMIEDYKEVPSSLDEVVAVFTFSINKAMKAKGWKVKLVREKSGLSPIPFSLRPIMEPLLNKPRTIEEFHGVENMCELYKKKTEPKNFRDLFAIKYKDRADQIIAILHKMIDGCTEARDVVKPIRAAIDAGVIDRPSWPVFLAEFPNAVCAKSSFERRTNPDDDYYRVKCKGTFEALVEYFASL